MSLAPTRTLRSLVLSAAFTALTGTLALTASVAQAQQQADFSKVEIKTIQLSEKVYALEGQGGTISVLIGNDDVLVVDSQFAPLTDKIVAAIRKLSDKPLRYLVNTHVHGDHTGGNENFGKLGLTIVARDQVRDRLINPRPAANGTPGKPAAAVALPVITFDGPTTLHVNGEAVSLFPIRSAHTDGDTLVRFTQADILAVGDYYRSVGWPVIDPINGGTVQGTIDGLGATIGRAGPNTKIVPGHGPVTNRAAVIAHRDLLIAVRDKVAPLVAQGKTVDEVIAAKPTAEWDALVPEGASNLERFLRALYADLKAGR